MQVSKWGNSLAIRLPAKLIAELGLKEGDEIDIRPMSERVIEIARKPTADELFDAMLKLRGSLPADYKFNREELYQRGGDDAE